jgi:hypothetical protein
VTFFILQGDTVLQMYAGRTKHIGGAQAEDPGLHDFMLRVLIHMFMVRSDFFWDEE